MAVLAHFCLATLVFKSQQQQSTQIHRRAVDSFVHQLAMECKLYSRPHDNCEIK